MREAIGVLRFIVTQVYPSAETHPRELVLPEKHAGTVDASVAPLHLIKAAYAGATVTRRPSAAAGLPRSASAEFQVDKQLVGLELRLCLSHRRTKRNIFSHQWMK